MKEGFWLQNITAQQVSVEGELKLGNDCETIREGWFRHESCMHTQSCPTLCDPMHCSLPGFSVHGILQARILEWVPFLPPGDLPDPGMEPKSPVSPASPALAGRFSTTEPPGKPQHELSVETKLLRAWQGMTGMIFMRTSIFA